MERCSRPTTPTAPSSRSIRRTVGLWASFRLATRRPTWPTGTGPSGFRYRARALCDRARDRDLPGDDLGPDILDLGLERARHSRADRAEADTAVPEGEAGSATGLERPAHERLDRVEHRYVQPLHRARQDVTAEVGLVDIDSDPPDSTLFCRLQRPEAASAGDLEDDSRSLRDLAQGDRAAHLLPGRERQHERSQVAGQITGLLFAEHDAQDVLWAMRQIVVGEIDAREPRFGKLGGDSVDRGDGKVGERPQLRG